MFQSKFCLAPVYRATLYYTCPRLGKDLYSISDGTPKMTGKIKRTKRRFRAGMPAVIRIAGQVHDAVAEDLGLESVSLYGDFALPEGDRVEVTLRSVAGDLRLSTTARLMGAVRDEDHGETHLSLRFERLDGEQSTVLGDMVSRVVEGVHAAALQSLPPGAGPDLVRRALDLIPLAHRIQLARKALPREREFLRQDPTPPVLDALARNPNLTLPEARQLARCRLILPATVEYIANDPRWRRDEDLKILIASHPRVSLQIAEKLALELDLQGLRKLLLTTGVSDPLKAKIRLRMSDREMRGW